MKTVIIGTDFVYDTAGNLKPVEINTNSGWSMNKIEDDANTWDDSQLKPFITSNGFTKITYIGSNYKIKTFLINVCQEMNIDFEEVFVSNTSITVPNIEDSDTNLIIRTAYDTTAILDETYCKNKVNFLNLIKDTDFSSQFAYLGEDGNIVNNITEIKDNGLHPNFILKAVEPFYDRTIYPKLYRVTNQEELNVILQNVNSEYFLMEYHINDDKLYNNQVTKIRKYSILYPPTLQSLHISSYTDLTTMVLDNTVVYDTETFEISDEHRLSYITKNYGNIDKPKLLDTDYVIMADGSLKTGLELQVGDIVKTINIPNKSSAELIEDETIDYNIDYNEFISGVTYNTNRVTNKSRIDSYVHMVSIQFSDGTSWSDTQNSRYLILSEGEIKFKRLENLSVGDVVLLIDTSNSETISVVQKTVASLIAGPQLLSGWVITVEETHLFLTKTNASPENSLSFAAIEHNDCNVVCGKGQCMITPWQMVQCVS